MKRCLATRRKFLRTTGAGVAGIALASHVHGDDSKKKKVLFLTKSSGYEHSSVRREGGALSHAEHVLLELGRKHGFDVEATKDASVFDGDLEPYAAFAFYTTADLTTPGRDMNPPMSPAGKQALLDAVYAGKGFVGFHCASDTFHSRGESHKNQDQKDPYIEMLGGEFITHGKQQQARMRVVDNAFPGMRRLQDGFTMHEEWYALKNFAPDLHVLLVIETEGLDGNGYQRPPYPATWVRPHGKGRVFYTSMGHREDVWTNPAFQSVTVGGMRWAIGDVAADISANIDQVTPNASKLASS